MAGFWPQPVQWIGVTLGLLCTVAASALGIYGVAFWITQSNFPGPLFAGAGIVLVLGIQVEVVFGIDVLFGVGSDQIDTRLQVTSGDRHVLGVVAGVDSVHVHVCTVAMCCFVH